MWAAFVVVHAWLFLVGVVWLPAETFWDLDLYRWWVWRGLHLGWWPVFDEAWVYPVGALVPMLAAALGGASEGSGFGAAWSLWVTAFDAAGVLALLHAPRMVGHRRIARTTAGAWWWIGFTALLGPVAMGRLDAAVAPLVLWALVVALRRPRVAAVLLTAGAWVKAAPGALILPLLAIVRRPIRTVAAPAAAFSGVVVLVVAALGGLPHVASFLVEQDQRGLQLEAVGATPWLVASLWSPGIRIGLNQKIITWEIYGPGAQGAADALGLLFVVGIAAAGAFIWWRSRLLGARLWSDEVARAQLLLRGAALIATLLIVLNKVGSPQYIGWIAPPVAVALALRLPGWRPTAALVAGIAGATQLVFPWAYGEITGGGPLMTGVLAARNVALVVLAAHCVRALVVETRPSPDEPAAGGGPATAWPPLSAPAGPRRTPPAPGDPDPRGRESAGTPG